jgi:phosphomannomutase/phosphoglucomutase
MEINPYIFRGYDIRGIAGKDLTFETMEGIGKAYGTWLKRNGIESAVVGYDCRLSGQELKTALIQGITSTGTDVIDIGMVLVMMVYFGQYHFKTKGAAMVTASHNPSEYNGCKLANGFSSTMGSEEMKVLREMVQKEDFETGKGKIIEEDISEAYFDKLLEKIKIEKKFKIAVDFSNATASKFFPRLADKIGAELVIFNGEIDGSFPNGTPDPTEKHLAERLAKETVDAKADIGMTFDADGDRLGVVDDKGTVIWNDLLVAIFAADVLDNNPGAKIVYNALCSKTVEETILARGGQPIMWMTGHSFIKAKLREEKAPFGGELSGHFFFVDKFYGHDDGFYAALRLLEYLSHRNKPFSEVLAEFPYYYSSPEVKIGSPDDKKAKVVENIKNEAIEKFPNEKINVIDGIRVDFKDGMFIIRFSQNGPYLSPKFEANSPERYEEIRLIVLNLLKKQTDIDWSQGVNLESLEAPNTILSGRES